MTVDQNVAVVRIVVRRLAAGISSSEGSLYRLQRDIIQADGRQHLIPIRSAHRNSAQILHGKGQGYGVFFIFHHCLRQGVSADEISRSGGFCVGIQHVVPATDLQFFNGLFRLVRFHKCFIGDL